MLWANHFLVNTLTKGGKRYGLVTHKRLVQHNFSKPRQIERRTADRSGDPRGCPSPFWPPWLLMFTTPVDTKGRAVPRRPLLLPVRGLWVSRKTTDTHRHIPRDTNNAASQTGGSVRPQNERGLGSCWAFTAGNHRS